MPEINITVESIARAINRMDRKSIEQLALLLGRDGKELIRRKREIQSKKVKTLSRREVFKRIEKK
jgi:hypothetical protein